MCQNSRTFQVFSSFLGFGCHFPDFSPGFLVYVLESTLCFRFEASDSGEANAELEELKILKAKIR